MILGFFSGTTATTIARRIEKVQKERTAIATTIDQAVADRIAAIREMQNDLDEIMSLKVAI